MHNSSILDPQQRYIQEHIYILQVHHSSFHMLQISLSSSLWWYNISVNSDPQWL